MKQAIIEAYTGKFRPNMTFEEFQIEIRKAVKYGLEIKIEEK